MTANQASPARPGLPGPQTVAGRPHDPAGHHATGRRPAGLPLAAVQKKTARYAPLLLCGAAAAVLAMASTPAMASTTGGRDTASAVSISAILKHGDIVTGVRGTTNKKVILTGSHANGDGTQNTKPFLYQGPLTAAARRVSALTRRSQASRPGRSTVRTPALITRTPSRQARSAPSEATGRPMTVSSTTA
jgi:hypothetical protein